MIKNKKATSVIEAMIVMMIVTLWIVWMYKIYFSWQDLSVSTKYRIEAIEIAREWIEAVKNIRDTNWLLFWADYENCWNTLNYDAACVWNTNWPQIKTESYVVYQNSETKWELFQKTTTATGFSSLYRDNFIINKDDNWFYTQTWWTAFKPLFTREIKFTTSNSGELNYHSIVRWIDPASTKYHEINLWAVLKNRIK